MFNLFSLLAFDNLNPMDWAVLEPALNFLWQGMLAIFVVIGLIIVSVKACNYAIVKAAEMKKAREEAKANSEKQEE
ncbi:MAG: hypothetical protein IKA72_04835 [Clostridia bacterium]|nr:hypothetical protein [Clostridia bacterium]